MNGAWWIKMNRLDLYITDFCNLKCKHCYMEGVPCHQLSFEQIKMIVKKAEEDYFGGKIEEINLLGGEPTLHPEFSKIVSYLTDENYRVRISTNGYFLNKIDSNILKKLNYIQLSCESLNKSVLDSYRGAGYFDNLIKATNLLTDLGIDFGYKILIAKDTLPYIEESIELAKKLGAKRISSARFVPMGNGLQNKQNDLTPEELQTAYEILFNAMIKNNIFVYVSDGVWYAYLSERFKDNFNFKGCAVLNGSMNVVANGDILLCRKIDIALGNILNDSDAFKKVKQSPIYKKLLNRELNGKCAKCSKKAICGGCRAYALVKNGDLLGDDTLCFINN